MEIQAILKMSGQDKSFVRELLELFIVQVKNDLTELKEASTVENWAAVQFTAHRMRSSIAPFGMAETIHILKSLEQELKEGITSGAAGYLNTIDTNCTEAVKAASMLLKDGF